MSYLNAIQRGYHLHQKLFQVMFKVLTAGHGGFVAYISQYIPEKKLHRKIYRLILAASDPIFSSFIRSIAFFGCLDEKLTAATAGDGQGIGSLGTWQLGIFPLPSMDWLRENRSHFYQALDHQDQNTGFSEVNFSHRPSL